MKKIFTLVATALCVVGVNAQDYQYTLTDADVALTQELINTVAENAGGTSAEIIIPGTKGTIDVYGLSDTGEKTGVSLPEGFSLSIKGEGEKPTLNFPKSFNLEGTHDFIRFENVKIEDGGCQYFINQSKPATVGELSLKGIEINGMERSLIRTQGTEAIKIDNIIVDNCVMTDMSNANGYSVFYFGTNTTTIGKLDIKNTTFNTSQRSFIEASKAPIANGVFISDCTFYNNVADGRYFMDANKQNTNLTMTNVILGKTYVETARGARAAGTMTFTNCLRTSDCVYSANDIKDLPAGEQSSTDIFTNPDNGDFTLKIDTKVGDPRWYKGGTGSGISSAVVEKAAVDAPAYNLAGQKVNDSFKGIVVKNGKKVVVK